MLIKEAKKIVGNLSKTSKMPCLSWAIPPDLCKTGALYSTYKDSICSQCYAKKGRNRFNNVKAANQRRFDKWQTETQWIEAMVTLIKKHEYFRWFTAGDIYNEIMFLDICKICLETPHTQHWLPTLERSIVLKHQNAIPENLTIRFSSPFIDKPSTSKFPISVVTSHPGTCPAIIDHRGCENCRLCWDKRIPIIEYQKH